MWRHSSTVSVVALLFLVVECAGLCAAQPIWGMSGHDVMHTSRSALLGPSGLTPAGVSAIACSSSAVLHEPMPTDTTGVVAVDGTVYVGDLSGAVAFSGITGAVKWNVSMGTSPLCNLGPALSTDGSVLYLLCYSQGPVFALNTTDGSKIWQTQGEFWSYLAPSSGLTLVNGTLYYSGNAALVAMNAATGAVNWYTSLKTNVSYWSTPAVAPDGKIFATAFGSYLDSAGSTHYSGQVFAFDSSGALLWTVIKRDSSWNSYSGSFSAGTGSSAATTLAQDQNGSVIVYSTMSNLLYALNATLNGTEMWSFSCTFFPIEKALVWCSPASLGADGTVYVTDPVNLYALDSTGGVKWNFSAQQPVGRPVIAADGTVYITPSHAYGDVQAVNGTNGALLWSMAKSPSHYTLATGVGGLAMGANRTLVTVFSTGLYIIGDGSAASCSTGGGGGGGGGSGGGLDFLAGLRAVYYIVLPFVGVISSLTLCILRVQYVRRSWRNYPIHNYLRRKLKLSLGHYRTEPGFVKDVTHLLELLKASGLDLTHCTDLIELNTLVKAISLHAHFPAARCVFDLFPNPVRCCYERYTYTFDALSGANATLIVQSVLELDRANSGSRLRTGGEQEGSSVELVKTPEPVPSTSM